ncbi:MAG TPA: hypothetical protein V6D28_09010 [Leptolyngbyaceae cyanobacterium]
MRLAPLYEQDREQAIKEGFQQGFQQAIQQRERLIIENVLRVRFGMLDEELWAIIPKILGLLPEEFVPLLLELSREELLAKFKEQK